MLERFCAACHGAAGRPDPNSPVVRALDPPPADLSDPLFNSREPAADWETVVRHGGAALELIAEIPFDPVAGEDDVKLSTLPQIRIGLTRGGHVALNIGVELPLSDQDCDWRGHAVLLWDFADGGFFKGWQADRQPLAQSPAGVRPRRSLPLNSDPWLAPVAQGIE